MKKITLLLLALTVIISCQVNEIESIQDDSLSRQTNSCTLNNSNPFSVQSLTHGYRFSNGFTYCILGNTYPNQLCFATELSSELYQEFNPQPIRNYVLNGTYSLNIITLSDFIDSSNLDPYISASNANIIYEEIVCQIRLNLSQLPPPPTNRVYGITKLDIQCDYPFSGPQNTTLAIEYKVNVRG